MSNTDTLVKNNINSDTNDLLLNNTLKIKHTTKDTHTNAGILLKNKSSTGSTPSFAELHVADSSGITNLYFNSANTGDPNDDQIVISNTNIESELEEVYNDRSLNIKNLSVGKDDSTDNVYVNFLSSSDTNTEDDGVGLKYEQNTGNIFYKNRGFLDRYY